MGRLGVYAALVTATGFKPGVASAKAPGGFDSHPPPLIDYHNVVLMTLPIRRKGVYFANCSKNANKDPTRRNIADRFFLGIPGRATQFGPLFVATRLHSPQNQYVRHRASVLSCLRSARRITRCLKHGRAIVQNAVSRQAFHTGTRLCVLQPDALLYYAEGLPLIKHYLQASQRSQTWQSMPNQQEEPIPYLTGS